MKYEDFVELAKKLCLFTDTPTYKTYEFRRNYGRKENKQAPIIPSIYKEWVVGGVTGGGCWEGMSADQSVSADTEPEMLGLDDLLTGICPKLTFLQYRKIEKLIKSYDYTNNEYYGNHTDYRLSYIVLQDLYDLITDLNAN